MRLLVAISVFALACGDDTTSAGGASAGGASQGGASAGGASTGGGSSSMCIQPGDVGNDIGVGHYCTPGGNECADFPLATLCLADVAQPEWFCTRIGCDETTNCGADAGCLIDPQGSACVLCACDSSAVGCGTGGAGTGGSAAGGAGGAG